MEEGKADLKPNQIDSDNWQQFSKKDVTTI